MGNGGVHPLPHAGAVHQLPHQDEERHGDQDETGVHVPGPCGHDVPQGSVGEEEHDYERQTPQGCSDVHPDKEEGAHQPERYADSHG